MAEDDTVSPQSLMRWIVRSLYEDEAVVLAAPDCREADPTAACRSHQLSTRGLFGPALRRLCPGMHKDEVPGSSGRATAELSWLYRGRSKSGGPCLSRGLGGHPRPSGGRRVAEDHRSRMQVCVFGILATGQKLSVELLLGACLK